jgi:hypothetical protein
MYSFNVTLHARSPQVARGGGSIAIAGRKYPTLDVPQRALSTGFLLSFEEAAAALARLPRMYVEPDGSFVWVSSAGEHSWQVDGVLYDRDGRLLFVDLNGTCPPADFDRLLSGCGWPQTEVMFQLTRAAVFVDEATFRDLAARR